MKHIVLKNKTETKSSIIYLSICNRCIKIEEEHAIHEDGYWEEYPVNELERTEIYKNLSTKLQGLGKREAFQEIIQLGLFKTELNELLKSYQLVKNYCDDTVIS